MKLTTRAIRKLNNKESKLRLALALGFTEQWVTKLLSQNRSNGPLTTVASIIFIEKETKLNQSEILEAGKPDKVGSTAAKI